MLNAAAAAMPAPSPAYNLPEPDPSQAEDDRIASDLQFMCMGILLGVLASLLYWQFAKACERIAKERRERDLCQQNPNDLLRGKQPGQPRTLFDCDEEHDDLKKYLP